MASVERHLELISTECREVLEWAAVLGSPFEFDLLAKMVGIEAERLLDLLEESIRTNLVAANA